MPRTAARVVKKKARVVKGKPKSSERRKVVKTRARRGPEIDPGLVQTPQSFKINFYAGILDSAEKSTRMTSNSLRYLEPLSTQNLQFDRALSGGLYNMFGSIAGKEGSGKSTFIFHSMASAIYSKLNFDLFIDAEGTMNATFAGNVFAQYGMNLQELMDKRNRTRSPFRYYRRSVIETVFDLLHFTLKRMPDKVWVPETNSWGYIIPKRNKYWQSVKEGLQLQEDKKLSTDNDFMCPTDSNILEGAVFLDSLAAMVTEADDEAEEKSKRRAAEAAAYSENFKRVASRISSKGMAFFASNQLRKVPGQTYGPTEYEPGGEACKFYSGQRLRIAERAPKEMSGVVRDKEIPSQALERSVHKEGAFDRYKYKHFKNTKNKAGFPGLYGYTRVWVADAFGNVRGFDPVFDTFEYLRDTGQLRTEGRRKGETLYVMRLKESVGRKRANLFNSLPPFTMMTFKRLILAEVERSSRLYKEAADELDVSPRHLVVGALRATLFEQIRTDKSVLQVKQKEQKGEDDDEDDVEEL